jgi:hypothetical protein
LVRLKHFWLDTDCLLPFQNRWSRFTLLCMDRNLYAWGWYIRNRDGFFLLPFPWDSDLFAPIDEDRDPITSTCSCIQKGNPHNAAIQQLETVDEDEKPYSPPESRINP